MFVFVFVSKRYDIEISLMRTVVWFDEWNINGLHVLRKTSFARVIRSFV